jgi:hypothetical protein
MLSVHCACRIAIDMGDSGFISHRGRYRPRLYHEQKQSTPS